MAPAETEGSAAAATVDASASESAQGEAQPIDIIDAIASRVAADEAAAGEASPETADGTDEPEEETTEETAEDEATEEEAEAESEESEQEATEEEAEAESEDDESEEEAEEETEEEEEPADLRKLKLDPKTRAAVQRVIAREIGKARGRYKEAEAKVTELTTTVEAAKQEKQEYESLVTELKAAKVVPAPTRQDPLVAHDSLDSLQRLEETSRAFKRWATLHPNGGPCEMIKGNDGQPEHLSAEQVAQLRANVDDDLDVHIPRRRMFLQEDRKYTEQCTALFPQLREKTHELTIATNDILANAPEFKRFPGARMGAVYYELGRRLVEKHQGKAWDVATGKFQPSAPAAKKRVPPRPVKTGPVPVASAPARTSQRPSTVPKDATLRDDDVTTALAERFGG